MKKLEYFLLVMIFLCASCAKDQWFDPPLKGPGNNNSPYNLICPQIKIAVVSDIHFMAPALMPDDINNADFQKKMKADRKLIELSDPIFKEVISELIAEKPDILLIPGDLSFEGEKLSHEIVSDLLQELENKGIKVYVIPGNNDINNPDAKDYSGDVTVPTENVGPDDFAEIYEAFGYTGDEIIARDGNSLSYICEPYEGLWILGIDANEIVTENGQKKYKIAESTRDWILDKIKDVSNKNITVLAMMHYGVIAHYSEQKKLEPLLYKADELASALMNAGIRIILTGHYHANDIVNFMDGGKILYDIQTGSLVTPPYSYRIMKLDDNFINIDSRMVTNVESALTSEMDFLSYSDVTLTSRINGFFTKYGGALIKVYGIPAGDYPDVVPFLTKAYKAYFGGDERLNPEERKNIGVLAESVPSSLTIINSFWTDLPPKDNKIHIKLK